MLRSRWKADTPSAISGLDEAEDVRAETGVPFLRKIPLVGWAFKNRTEGNGRQHLMMFITPTILSPNDEGVTEVPQTRRAGEPEVGPAVSEFEPTIMQYAAAHRPVPTRSLRSDYPDSRSSRNAPSPGNHCTGSCSRRLRPLDRQQQRQRGKCHRLRQSNPGSHGSQPRPERARSRHAISRYGGHGQRCSGWQDKQNARRSSCRSRST